MDYFIHQSSYIDRPCKIGLGTNIWHFSHIMSNCKIGINCNIGQNVFIASNVIIGDNVKIQNNVSLYEGIVCEDNVFIGPSCVFTNVINPRSFIDKKHEFRSTLIKHGASLGANSTIICGNTIGKYALIGAGAVVTRDIPDYSVVVGNPARIIYYACCCGAKIIFDKYGSGSCPNCFKQYKKLGYLVTDVHDLP